MKKTIYKYGISELFLIHRIVYRLRERENTQAHTPSHTHVTQN